MQIEAIPIFKDNYVWLLHDGQHAIVVDPGDADPVNMALCERGLCLKEIWVTHHHADHVAGVPALTRAHAGVTLRAPAESPLPQVTHPHANNDRFTLVIAPAHTVAVWCVPGHTSDHIAYLLETETYCALFCGDTLFGAGCGRLLGGSAAQLHASLQRIAALPDDTRIYCTHEYTENNLKFAQEVEPGNPRIAARSERVHLQRVKGNATVPFTLEEERETNPFLRTHVPDVYKATLKHSLKKSAQPAEVFAYLRAWKDTF